MKPTHYTLRYGGSGGDSCIRNWQFEASTDGTNYVVLQKCDNDKSIDGGYASATFKLDNVNKFYRFFRVKQTGKNKNGTDFLLNTGFELYGQLRRITNYKY